MQPQVNQPCSALPLPAPASKAASSQSTMLCLASSCTGQQGSLKSINHALPCLFLHRPARQPQVNQPCSALPLPALASKQDCKGISWVSPFPRSFLKFRLVSVVAMNWVERCVAWITLWQQYYHTHTHTHKSITMVALG